MLRLNVKLSEFNACTLVSTVFRWHKKNGIQISFLFFVFLRPSKMEFHFHFYFSFDVYLWHWKTDLNFVFRVSFSHHFGKRISISFFVLALLVIEKQIGVFCMNLKSGLIHQSFETPPPLPLMRGLSLHNHPIFIPRWAMDTLEIPVFASLTGE